MLPKNFLPGYKVRSINSLLTYLSALVLLLSLFIPVQGISTNLLQKISIRTLIVGALAWWISGILRKMEKSRDKGKKQTARFFKNLTVFLHILLDIIILINYSVEN